MRARRESTAVTQKPGAPAGALGHSTNILQILTLLFLPRLLGCLVEFSFHVTAELNLILQPSLDVSHTKGFGPPPAGCLQGHLCLQMGCRDEICKSMSQQGVVWKGAAGNSLVVLGEQGRHPKSQRPAGL